MTKKRAIFLVHEYLSRNKKSWALWAIKYRKDFTKILRHVHLKNNANYEQLLPIWRYLKYNEHEKCPPLIHDYVAVQNGDKDKLAKLPATVAEGFMKKFNLTTEDFWKLFNEKGGQFTAKEKQLKATSVAKAGASTGFDLRKAPLFDSLVYLHSLNEWPMSVSEIKNILDQKAKAIADKLLFKLQKVAVILDTSISMYGTAESKYHPMLRGLAISMVLKHASEGFKEFRTNGDEDKLFPKLKNQSNYADCLIKALKEGFTTIAIIGDAYENAPFEGAFHQVLFTYKKKLDKKNKLMTFHFNPVFAAEAKNVRSVSSIAEAIGVREISALNEAMFLSIARQKPTLAIAKYFNYLVTLQNKKATELMPASVKAMISKTETKFIEE